jgi:mRNA interferase RelE/StbE
VITFFKPAFLKDLAGVPLAYRRRIEKLVFEDIPRMSELGERIDIRKIQGRDRYCRIRIGDYRIGCEINEEHEITFFRVKHRKDIYKVFP